MRLFLWKSLDVLDEAPEGTFEPALGKEPPTFISLGYTTGAEDYFPDPRDGSRYVLRTKETK